MHEALLRVPQRNNVNKSPRANKTTNFATADAPNYQTLESGTGVATRRGTRPSRKAELVSQPDDAHQVPTCQAQLQTTSFNLSNDIAQLIKLHHSSVISQPIISASVISTSIIQLVESQYSIVISQSFIPANRISNGIARRVESSKQNL